MGAADFLLKPFTLRNVVTRVQELLSPRAVSGPTMTCNILLAENDALVIEKIVRKFERQGFPIDLRIVTFKTQNDILSHAQNDHPKVIFFDLVSRDIPLEETIKKIRSDVRLQKTPIVIHGHWMLTGSLKVNEKENIHLMQQTYLAAGANYYVERFSELSFLLALYEFFPESLHGIGLL